MPFEIPEDLHPDLLPYAWLLGHWHGSGRTEYPGVEPFEYEQDAAFTHDGRAFLHYFSQSWRREGADGEPPTSPDDAPAPAIDSTDQRGEPESIETGFLRPAGEGNFELVLAHPTGHVEIWYGSVEPARLTLATDAVVRTETAEEYTAGQRMYGLVEGDLMYAIDRATSATPMQSHSWGRLARQ